MLSIKSRIMAQFQIGSSDALAVRLTLACFVLLALLGGASRGDELAIVFLRPLILLLAAVSLWVRPPERIGCGRSLVLTATAIALLCLLQLIPLPPSLWAEMPGRSAIVGVDEILFDELPWRPLTMVPSATYNAMFYSLTIAAVFSVIGVVANDHEIVVLRAIIVIAIISVILAIFSAQTGAKLYRPYEIMSQGPSGLFSNANHFGMFCALAILVALRLASKDAVVGRNTARWFAFAGFALLMLVGAILSSSRLAFGASGIALICSALVFCKNVLFIRGFKKNVAHTSSRQTWLIGGLVAIAIILLILLFLYLAILQREASLGNFEEVGLADSLRVRITPILISMLSDHWLAGIGFGSFADYYAIIEPVRLVGPQYVNQAHNDFAQFVIEGGLLAALIGVSLLVWLGLRLLVLVQGRHSDRFILVVGLVMISGLGSAFDYVLRVPLFASVVGGLLMIWLTAGEKEKRISIRA